MLGEIPTQLSPRGFNELTLNLISKLNQRVFLRRNLAALPSSHRRRSMTEKIKPKTKAELLEMLAEVVSNTQPQPVHKPQPEPVSNPQPARQRKTQTRPAPKRTAKIKSVRASARRKQRRR